MPDVDLSHVIVDGMETYPDLPAPVIADHLTRAAAEKIYGPGGTFQIGMVTLCSNTGTYIDVPFHRFADRHDLSGLQLDRVASVPAVCFDRRGEVTIELSAADVAGLADHAVLLRTGHSTRWGSESYFVDHPYLTAASAERLAEVGVACVGIDSLNIDSTVDGQRPVHPTLLGSEIPIIEHLTTLDVLPRSGFRFTAVPPKIEGVGTFTVRAFASL